MRSRRVARYTASGDGGGAEVALRLPSGARAANEYAHPSTSLACRSGGFELVPTGSGSLTARSDSVGQGMLLVEVPSS